MTLMTRKKCKDKHILSPNTVNLILGKDAIYVTTLKRDTYKAVLGIFRRTRQTNSTQNLHFPPKCCIFAPSTNENAIRALQGASITTKVGHNRRPTPVIY